jgi:hypothetical protein
MTVSSKTYVLISPRTAAVTAPNYGKFNSSWYQHVVLASDQLAGAEEVDIFIEIDGNYIVASDWNGDVAKLTATAPSVTLPGGPVYAVLKDATAASAGVYALLSLGAKRR